MNSRTLAIRIAQASGIISILALQVNLGFELDSFWLLVFTIPGMLSVSLFAGVLMRDKNEI